MGQHGESIESRGTSTAPSVEIDYLVCGLCQRDFPLANIVSFVQHKKFDCDDFRDYHGSKSRVLLCQSCPRKFNTPWRLLQHAQSVHSLHIYFEQGEHGITPHTVIQQTESPSLTTTDMSLFEEYLTSPSKTDPTVIDQHNYSIKLDVPQSTSNEVQDTSCTVNTVSQNTNNNITAPLTSNGSLFTNLLPLTPIQSSDVACQIDLDAAPNMMSKSTEEVILDDKVDRSVPLLLHELHLVESPVETGSQQQKLKKSSKGNKKLQSAMSHKKNKATLLDKEEEDSKCCDNQDCGVTVMPVTHEELKKCCNAVIPKKRKRHMEIKHLSASGRGRRRSSSSGEMYTRKTKTVLIDIENSETPFTLQKKRSLFQRNESESKYNTPETYAGQNSAVKPEQIPGSSSQTHSIIIEPGTTLSIPVSDHGRLPPISSYLTHPSTMKTFQDNNNIANSNNKRKPTKEIASLDANELNSVLGFLDLAHSVGEKSTDQDQESSVLESGNLSIHLSTEDGNSTANSSLPSDHQMINFSGVALETTGVDMKGSVGFRKRRYPTSRPFKCDQCNQAFNQRIHLKKHQSKHTGVKPFQCQQCDYSTVEKSHLKVHIRVHTGEKPYKCTYCEYATAQNSTLKIHLRRHHQGTAGVRCLQCKKEFTEPEYLTTHTKTEHQAHRQVVMTDAINLNNSLPTQHIPTIFVSTEESAPNVNLQSE